jgi:Activator of Hsp90 ATPase homolog 1-like protein
VIIWVSPQDQANKAKHSRVSFDIVPIGDMVRLSVTHDELEAGSKMDQDIRQGWPRVLSSLKSFLETGKPLDTWAGRK